jgi:hypothetical protein
MRRSASHDWQASLSDELPQVALRPAVADHRETKHADMHTPRLPSEADGYFLHREVLNV